MWVIFLRLCCLAGEFDRHELKGETGDVVTGWVTNLFGAFSQFIECLTESTINNNGAELCVINRVP